MQNDSKLNAKKISKHSNLFSNVIFLGMIFYHDGKGNFEFKFSETDSGILTVTFAIYFITQISLIRAYYQKVKPINDLIQEFTKINLPPMDMAKITQRSRKVHLYVLLDALGK